MGRTRIPDARALQTWDDVNQALKEIAEMEIRMEHITGEMNIKINEIKQAAKASSATLEAKKESLGKQLKEFAELNRPDFGKAKSKVLTFGELGFRASTSVTYNKALEEKIIENLRRLGMDDCVRITEDVNKEILKTYPVEKVIEAGAKLKRSDTFWFETDKQQLV